MGDEEQEHEQDDGVTVTPRSMPERARVEITPSCATPLKPLSIGLRPMVRLVSTPSNEVEQHSCLG